MRSSYQMLAQISPSTYSSSFNLETGTPSSRTSISRVTENVCGSRNRIVAEPSLMMSCRPSCVSPQPSPSYCIVRSTSNVSRSYTTTTPFCHVSWYSEAAQDRDAFAEVARPERALLLGAAAREIDAPHRRGAVLARALVELPRFDREALRERRGIVRIRGDDLEARRPPARGARRAAPRPQRRRPTAATMPAASQFRRRRDVEVVDIAGYFGKPPRGGQARARHLSVASNSLRSSEYIAWSMNVP